MQNLNEAKAKALELAKAALEKQFGKGIISATMPDIEFIDAGSPSINKALGGGWARGRIHEVYGPESSGKTTLSLHAVAGIQRSGGVAAFIDVEHALDIKYASNLGVNTENLIISQPDNGEQALEVVGTLAQSGAVDLIVIDSVAALVPQKEIEGDMGDAQMGAQARLMSQAMRKLTGVTSKTNCTIIFINQIRMKLGVMFGNPETTTGGNALKFYASQRVDVRRTGTLKEGTGDDAEVVANKTRVKVVKNKVAPPFREAEFIIRFGSGIDTNMDLLRMAVAQSIIEKSGAWYSFNGQRIGQGEPNACAFVKNNPEIAKAIVAKLA